jgi:hypothetical protein
MPVFGGLESAHFNSLTLVWAVASFAQPLKINPTNSPITKRTRNSFFMMDPPLDNFVAYRIRFISVQNKNILHITSLQ